MPSPNHTKRIDSLTRELGISRGETALLKANIELLEECIMEMRTVANAGMVLIYNQHRAAVRDGQKPEANPLNESSESAAPGDTEC